MKRTNSLYDLGGAGKQRGLPASGGAKSASGFTMIEVLIVIVILAILSSIAIPGFSRWLPNYRLKGAARDLYSSLQIAKSGAIRDQANWSIQFSGNTYVVGREGGGTPFKTVNLADYGSNVRFDAGSATEDVNGNSITAMPGSPIVFNSRGFTNDENAVFAYLTNSKNTSFAVGTLISGAVVLRKWNASAWE